MTVKKKPKGVKKLGVDSKAIVTLEEWCNFFSKKMAHEVFNAFEAEYGKVGGKNHANMVAHFLAGFVSAVVYRSLAYIPVEIVDRDKQYDYAEKSFADTKLMLQDAVASGVQGGIFTWSGQSVEYYAQIKAVPEPKSKVMN